MELTPLITVTLGRGAKAASGSPVAESGTFAHDLAKANLPADEKASQATSGKPPTDTADMPATFDTASSTQGRASLAVMRQALGEGMVPDGRDTGLSEIAERLVLIETAGREAALASGDNPTAAAAQAPLAAWQLGDVDSAQTASLELVPQPEISPEALTEANGELRLETGDSLSPIIAAQQAPLGEIPRDARFDSLLEGRQTRADVLNAKGLIQATQSASSEASRTTQNASLTRSMNAEPLSETQAWPPQESSRFLDTPGPGAGVNTAGTQPNGAVGASATQATMSAPLNSPAWPQQLTQQVGQQLMTLIQRGGEQRVELHLNPAELGPLSISLKMNEQAAQLQFLSAHAQVRGAVEQAIPQLREALAEQGIQLGETSVGEQRQEAGRDFAGSSGRGSPGGEEAIGESEASMATGMTTTADNLLEGRVDLYA